MEKQQETVIELDGVPITFDEDGFLRDFNAWSPGLALYLSKNDGINLTDDHWEIIHFVRNYFVRYQISPLLKIIVKSLNREAGFEKHSIKGIFSLFPHPPGRAMCRYAGIPMASGCT